MLRFVVTMALISASSAQVFHKLELSNERTPYDLLKERMVSLRTVARTARPLSNSYKVKESEENPEKFEGAESAVLNTAVSGVGGVGGVGLGQGLGVGGIGYGGLGGIGLGQGIGLGLGGVGQIGYGGIGAGGIGAGGLGVGNVGLINPGLGGLGVAGVGLGGGLLYHPIIGNQQVGGGYIDKKAYDAAQKKGADDYVEKLEKKVEEEAKHGQEGFQAGSAAAKAAKGDSSYYKDEEAKKKAAGDEKFYEGGQKFDKHGANEEQLKKAKSHKKGHVSKGFKSSSSKNEEEKTESFYDEAHDEGDHKILGQNAGSFGENAHQGFKGAHEEKVLDANAQGKEGHHVSEQKIDDAKADKGEYLNKGYKGGAEVLEKSNNLGAHSIHGHQEASGGFQQNKGLLTSIHRR